MFGSLKGVFNVKVLQPELLTGSADFGERVLEIGDDMASSKHMDPNA